MPATYTQARRRAQRATQVAHLVEQGLDTPAIAEEIGLSQRRVCTIRAELGISAPQGRPEKFTDAMALRHRR